MSSHTQQQPNVENCPICCDDFKTADLINCPVCKYHSCQACTKQYLLNSRNAQCMDTSCKALWGELFLRKTFPKGWIDKHYIPYQRSTILDQERSWLPETMPHAAIYKAQLEADKAFVNHKKRMKEAALSFEENYVSTLHMLYNTSLQTKREWRAIRDQIAPSEKAKEKPKVKTPQYVMKCPSATCNAFISADTYSCSMCSTNVCRKCRQVKDARSPHTCNQSDVDSVKAILEDKDVRPCPKCCELIYRPHGCNHMWCTACNTGFDWKTGGLIDNSVNTNPYFFQWRAQHAKASTNVQDISTRLCSEDVYDILTSEMAVIYNQLAASTAQYKPPSYTRAGQETLVLIRNGFRRLQELLTQLNSIRRDCNNVLSVECQYSPIINRQSRIKYLAGEYDDKRFAMQVSKSYKRFQYNMEIRNILSKLSADIATFMLDTILFLNENKKKLTEDVKHDIGRLNYVTCFSSVPAYLTSTTLDEACNRVNSVIVDFNKRSSQAAKLFHYTETIMVVTEFEHRPEYAVVTTHPEYFESHDECLRHTRFKSRVHLIHQRNDVLMCPYIARRARGHIVYQLLRCNSKTSNVASQMSYQNYLANTGGNSATTSRPPPSIEIHAEEDQTDDEEEDQQYESEYEEYESELELEYE